jgi:hypothetical protein
VDSVVIGTRVVTPEGLMMADKSPHKPSGKKHGRSLKEKRAAKKLKRDRESGPPALLRR